MSNASKPAFPVNDGPVGLTKREYFAGLALQGIESAMSSNHYLECLCIIAKEKRVNLENVMAKAAIERADALLAELEKSNQ